MGENNLNKIKKTKSKKKGTDKSEESSTGESDPKKPKVNKTSKDKKKPSSLKSKKNKENDPDFQSTDSSIEEPDEYSSQSSQSSDKKRRPIRRRTHVKYAKKKNDNYNTLAEVQKNTDGTGPYKTLRPGGNKGITHEMPYKFATKHFIAEKRTSKPTAHYVAQQSGKSPRKKSTPKKKKSQTPEDTIG